MSLNQALEHQFVKRVNDESYTPEQIYKFSHRWSYKRGRKREFRILLD